MSIEIIFKEETDLNDPSTDTKFDLTDCCRTCLGLECSLTPTNSLDSDSIKFSDKLAACVSGMKWANEGLPSFICGICIDKLRIAYDFQTVCLQSDQAFQLQEEANKIYTSKDATPEPTTITDLAKCDEAMGKVILTVKHKGMQLQPLPQCAPVPSAIVQLKAMQILDNPRKGGCKVCGKELCEHIALNPTTITGLAGYDEAKEKVILNVKHEEMQLQPFPHCAPVAPATVQLKAMQTLDNPRKGGCKVCGKELCEHIALNPMTITGLAGYDEAKEKVILNVKLEEMQLQPFPHCAPVAPATVHLEAMQTLDNPRKGGCKVCERELCEHIALDPTTITGLAEYDEAKEKVILNVKLEEMQLQPFPHCAPVAPATVHLEAMQTLDNPRKGGCKVCERELCEHIALDPTTITGLAEYDEAKEKVILNVKHEEMQLQPFPHCAPVAPATVQLKAMQILDNPRKGGCKVCGKELCEHIALNPTTITGLAGYDEAKEKVILNVKLEEMQLQPFPRCAPATVHLEAMQTLDNPRKGGCKVCGKELCEHIALDPTTITGLAGYDEAKEKVILTVKPEGMQLQPLPHCAPVISATAQLEAMQILDNPRKGGCKVCGKELCEHIQMYISEPLACSYCDKKFSRKCVLNSHLKTHIGDKLSRDQICNKSFTKSHLTQYMKRRSGKKFRCELCDKTFTRFFSLKVHIRMHSGAERWQCRICNKSHTQSGSLTLHMKTHTGEKFLNKLCGQESGHYHHLSSHKWEHAGKQPYKCTVCDKVCLNAVQLQAHMIKHTGEKLICPICDKKFTTRYMLNCHLKSHTGENKFNCSLCDRTFTHSCNLKTHMRTHTGEKPFGCKLCGKKFTQSCSLNLHMKIHTGEKFLCTLCGQDFRHFYQLSVHRREHTGKQPYKCILCGKVCTYAAQFQTHMIKHTGEKLTCSTCDKRFTNRYALNSHLKTHTGENSK